MRIAIGADHGGYELKRYLVESLTALGHQVEDFGTYRPEAVDYPDIAIPLARAVAAGEYERGILICGTGIGMSITANKVPGVRAALCTDGYMARKAREHNDAQILCLGGRVVGADRALEIAQTFLACEFQGGRHARRVGKIARLDETRSP